MFLAIFVFLSYARADLTPAREIAAALRAAGCSVWTDEQVRPGRDWRREIERQIDRADVVLVLVSAESYRSRYVRAELARAERKAKRIVPLLIEEGSDMPLSIERLQRVERGRVKELCR